MIVEIAVKRSVFVCTPPRSSDQAGDGLACVLTGIDDDSPDQLLYAALPAIELPPLLKELARREGLALIAFDHANLPPETRPFVLSPQQAKGLDFHSVCVLNGGALLRRIVDQRLSDVTDALAKRLAIDELRVVLSRPTERLIWHETPVNRKAWPAVKHRSIT